MARRQRGQLDPPASEEAIRGDEQGIRSAKHSVRERRVDLAASTGIEKLDMQPEGASGRFQLCQRGRRIFMLPGLTSTATRTAAGTSSRKSPSRFASLQRCKKIETGCIAARTGEARDKAKLDWVFGNEEGNRDRLCRRFGRDPQPRSPPPRSHSLAADQIGGQLRHRSIDLQPAIVDCHVLAIDVACLRRAPGGNSMQYVPEPAAMGDKKPDHRHRRLLAHAPRAATQPPRRRAGVTNSRRLMTNMGAPSHGCRRQS